MSRHLQILSHTLTFNQDLKVKKKKKPQTKPKATKKTHAKDQVGIYINKLNTRKHLEEPIKFKKKLIMQNYT